MSKDLSWLLRHNAVKEGLHISDNGFVKVADILNHKRFRNKYTVDDILRIVETNDKQRFTIGYDKNKELQICANQGHSIQVSTRGFL